MTEPTEDQKQEVIAHFKEQGFELYNVEGINKVYAELAEAKSLLSRSVSVLHAFNYSDIDDIYGFLNK